MAFEYRPEKMASHGISENVAETLRLYVEHGIEPGGAVFTILENQPVRDVVAYCDDATLAQLRPIIRWLYNDAPSQCWGSRGEVTAWMIRGGIAGREG
jgi:hypothetical protein